MTWKSIYAYMYKGKLDWNGLRCSVNTLKLSVFNSTLKTLFLLFLITKSLAWLIYKGNKRGKTWRGWKLFLDKVTFWVAWFNNKKPIVMGNIYYNPEEASMSKRKCSSPACLKSIQKNTNLLNLGFNIFIYSCLCITVHTILKKKKY